MRIPLLFWLIVMLWSCGSAEKDFSWQLVRSIPLDTVNPIGLTFTEEGLWLSDGDRNRLVLVDKDGNIIRTIDSLERPMHITSVGNTLYVPLYGNDLIARIAKKAILPLPLKDSLDAPASISVFGKEIAIADFYNHRILYSPNGETFSSIGTEGKGEGEFYYPTDVQITQDLIWVADAYNNRVQAFTKDGKFKKSMGSEEKMNAATGIFVSAEEIFVTDFENHRVLIFDHTGKLKQTLSQGVEKPTDVLIKGDSLYIANYRNGSLQLLERKVKS